MKVALVGFSKKSMEIFHSLLSLGDEVVSFIDSSIQNVYITNSTCSLEALMDADIVIDFSKGESLVENMIMYSRLALPALIVTTLDSDQKETVEALCYGEDTKILCSDMFSTASAEEIITAARWILDTDRIGIIFK